MTSKVTKTLSRVYNSLGDDVKNGMAGMNPPEGQTAGGEPDMSREEYDYVLAYRFMANALKKMMEDTINKSEEPLNTSDQNVLDVVYAELERVGGK